VPHCVNTLLCQHSSLCHSQHSSRGSQQNKPLQGIAVSQCCTSCQPVYVQKLTFHAACGNTRHDPSHSACHPLHTNKQTTNTYAHTCPAGFEKALEGQLAAGAAYSESITWAKVWTLLRVPSNWIIVLQVGGVLFAGFRV
jgi:hypothetical protein